MTSTPLTLTTERLRLRPMTLDDVAAVYEIFSDPDTMKYWSTPPHTSTDDSRALIERAMENIADGKTVSLAITTIDDESNQLIGLVTLHSIDKASAHAELGYILNPDFRKQGFMIEAVTALLRHGFETMKLHRVEASIDPDNLASGAVLKTLGFQLEGLLRERWCVNDVYYDGEIYSLLVHEFSA